MFSRSALKFFCSPFSSASPGAMLQKIELPMLQFAYEALEPVIGRETVLLHYSGHHQAYVNNYNSAIEKFYEASGSLTKQLEILGSIKFNAGGHLNHSLYWDSLQAYSEKNFPQGDILSCINKHWGSFDALKAEFISKGVAIQGSGYAWLSWNLERHSPEVLITANQDTLVAERYAPLICVDVWEHSYYLNYKNKRLAYLQEIWKLINWNMVCKRFKNATK